MSKSKPFSAKIVEKCGKSGCPAIFETSRGTFVIQGAILESTEQTVIDSISDNKRADNEGLVEIPRDLLQRMIDRRDIEQ